MMDNINWYPGHMKKTKDMINEQLKMVDVVIEILDARIPFSSKNPDISKWSKGKKRIIILNKVDLVDDKKIKEYLDYFIENNLADKVIAISTQKGKNIQELKKYIQQLYEEKLKIVKKKGLIKTEIRALVAGIPNVGKSMFINRMAKKNKAKVGNTPGFTRGKQWIKVDDKFELLDTPGVLWPKFDNAFVAGSLAITGSIKDNVLPIEEVCKELLNRMKKYSLLENINKAYKIEDDLYKLENYEILNLLMDRLEMKNVGENDYYNISLKVLREYRQGKLGKFFLETTKESWE